MTTSIRPIPAGGEDRRPALVGPAAEKAEAMAWLRAHLQWERRLTEIRRAQKTPAPTAADRVPDGQSTGPTISRRARAHRAVAAVLLGASATAGVLFLAPPSKGSSPSTSPGLTPIARPASGAAFNTPCSWRSRGWFCSPAQVFTVRAPGVR
jgi:hypothetical protein